MDQARWGQLTLKEQFGNIGSEISRAKVWRDRRDEAASVKSIERAFELLDLTMEDVRWRGRLKEICRFREVLADQYVQSKIYDVSLNDLELFCMDFAIAARRHI